MKAGKWIVLGTVALVGAIWIRSATSQRDPVVKEALQQVAEDKGLSPDEVKDDPELQKQMREEIEARRTDPEFREEIRRKLTEQRQKEQEEPKEEAGYGPISKKNLFKPLGSGKRRRARVSRSR